MAEPCITAVPLGDRSVLVRRVWRVASDACTLYLLDTDLEENALGPRARRRDSTAAIAETRIQQEIVLGIGGVRAPQVTRLRAQRHST